MNLRKNYGKVVGTSFKNPDGTSRQEILAKLGKYRQVKLVHTTFLNENDVAEPAIEVRDVKTGIQIGYIARTEIQNMWNVKGYLLGVINSYNGIFGMSLSENIQPTAKQYHYVKQLCEEVGEELPCYDAIAYSAWLDVYESES